jgi:galactokinase
LKTTYFAPGRVNLIGEHLDYNDGPVMPAALTLGVKLTVDPGQDDRLVLRSGTHEQVFELSVQDDFSYNVAMDWANYPLGILAALKKMHIPVKGMELYFESDLPQGTGLSSSAAVEVVTAFALLHQAGVEMPLKDIALLCQRVENEFIGVQCGIMDQYAVALGKKDNALLLDCAKLEHQYIPVELDAWRLIIMNTNKPRSLIQSAYNERKQQCGEALAIVRNVKPELPNLASADLRDLKLIPDNVLYRRARHVLCETARVRESVKALKYNDLFAFGKLMNASHASLKEDYEVTGLEQDALAEAAQQAKGCLGARMTGGGFGGCAIAIVEQASVDRFIQEVGEKYLAKTGYKASFYDSEMGDGVRIL